MASPIYRWGRWLPLVCVLCFVAWFAWRGTDSRQASEPLKSGVGSAVAGDVAEDPEVFEEFDEWRAGWVKGGRPGASVSGAMPLAAGITDDGDAGAVVRFDQKLGPLLTRKFARRCIAEVP